MADEPLRIRILSDGTAAGTEVFDTVSGRRMTNVVSAAWRCDPASLAVVTLELFDVEVDLVGATEQEK